MKTPTTKTAEASTAAKATEVRIVGPAERAAFDRLALHPMQSYAWGMVRQEMGLQVVRLGRYDAGVLTAVYQMTVHKIPHTAYSIGYVPRSAVPDAATVAFVRAWALANKVVFVKWEPYAPAEPAAGEAGGEAALLALPNMRRSPHPLFTEWNQEVDLRPSLDDIQKRFRKTTRYSIRHAAQVGVTAREMSTDEGFGIFADLYFSTTHRQAYHGHTRKYHQTIWRTLSKEGIAKIFVAFYDGKPHAAYELFFWHDRAYYPYSGSASADRHVPATQLLMWECVKYAKERGCAALDLWGSLPPEHDAKHPWAGFTLFKRGFGTSFVRMTPSADLVARPFLYFLYCCAYKARKAFWKTGVL